jgi:hypothetical protein
MWHPLSAIPAGRRRRAFVPLLLATLAVMTVMIVVDQPLRTAAAPKGVVSFEFAGDVATARAMLDSWDARAREFAGFSLGFDYVFMIAYSTTTALACLWAAGVWAPVAPALAALGPGLAWGSWAAGLCDAVENAALTVLLLGQVADPWPAIAWVFALVKFVLLYAAILYALMAVGVRLVRGPTPR